MRIRRSRTWTKVALSLFLLRSSPLIHAQSDYESDYSSSSKRIRKNNDPMARRFRVRNLSSSALEVFWVNMMTEEKVWQFELVAGAGDTLNSHVLHEFEVREKANKKGECNGRRGRCRKKHFQITEDEDQIFSVDEEFQISTSNSRTRAEAQVKEALQECRDMEQSIAETAAQSTIPSQLYVYQLAECLQRNAHQSRYHLQEEIDFQATIRRKMGKQLKDYACVDPTFPTTKPLNVKEWNPNNPQLRMDNLNHTVHVLLQSDTTMIATIENIARPTDCQFVQEATQVPWEARKNPAVLGFLTRIYAYVDPAVKLMNMHARLPQKGEMLFEVHQDGVMEYGNGEDQTTRNYLSDWPVDGPNFARLIMFCDVPETGGAMHFPESGVHVNPKVGQGLLITYSQQSMRQGAFVESFRNEYYDCPIVEGTRTIVQHQFRLFPNNNN